jgi:hypothetical protein
MTEPKDGKITWRPSEVYSREAFTRLVGTRIPVVRDADGQVIDGAEAMVTAADGEGLVVAIELPGGIDPGGLSGMSFHLPRDPAPAWPAAADTLAELARHGPLPRRKPREDGDGS